MSSFTDIPKNYQKKIDKEIFSIFEIETYNKELVFIDDDVLQGMTEDFDAESFYKIIEQEVHLGYFYLGTAPSKADVFDYIVIFDKDMIIKKIKILAYREDWGGEITSKRWLKQFKGSDPSTSLKYGSDVMGISGATISARSMTNAVNALLLNLSKLQE
ncbi:FMN-binding protein [Lutimonas zeaxanthinifaciens]|uniref:FMN-binding protein n=1 Tax=Lutimonas zeaxanthinifaciens TaxID=3060215 RepID=UPI00265D3BD8|nr:FMN-binding protein [Lutimonas sp. YSD2104]WKK66991.1 FMN-binding protein [Lutimonas sp. YSD2104]